jgi:hypothetical protein
MADETEIDSLVAALGPAFDKAEANLGYLPDSRKRMVRDLLDGLARNCKETKPMRDPARIDIILSRLRDVWYQHPDQRLGQLLINIGNIENGNTSKMFNREDDVWLELITKGFNEQDT